MNWLWAIERGELIRRRRVQNFLGWYESIAEGGRCKVKHVKGGADLIGVQNALIDAASAEFSRVEYVCATRANLMSALACKKHRHRDEYWVVVKDKAQMLAEAQNANYHKPAYLYRQGVDRLADPLHHSV